MKDPIACRTQSSVCVYLSKGNISASRLIFAIWNGFLSACNQLDDDLMEKELTRDANVIINEYPVAPIFANSFRNVLYEIKSWEYYGSTRFLAKVNYGSSRS